MTNVDIEKALPYTPLTQLSPLSLDIRTTLETTVLFDIMLVNYSF